MRIDFYQLGTGSSAEGVIASIAGRLVGEGERLLVVSGDEAQLSRLDRGLWDHSASSFIPHGLAGGVDDTRQPILLSTGIDAPNGARNLLIADGEWREAAHHFERTFYLFDGASIEGAREAWKDLAGAVDAERHFWASEDGKWVEKG